MKKFISFILSLTLAVTTAISLCSCTPPPPQLMNAALAYKEGYITDEDIMNIACIAGNGPYNTYTYEPIDFKQTIEFSQISNEELLNIANELFGNHNNVVLNENLFIYYFGEYHGYYALGIDYPNIVAIPEKHTSYFIYDIAWDTMDKDYTLYIYTTPEKTKV